MIYYIIFFLIFGLIIWFFSEQDEKEREKPLNNEDRKHYFVKMIIDATKEVKNIKEEEKLKLFLEKENTINKSIYEATDYSEHLNTVGPTLALGAMGGLLALDSKKVIHLVNEIYLIIRLWAFSLFYQQKERDEEINIMDKQRIAFKVKIPFDKEEVWKNVLNKSEHLMNLKISLMTNKKDIRDAWETIFKDKSIEEVNMKSLYGEVEKILSLKDGVLIK